MNSLPPLPLNSLRTHHPRLAMIPAGQASYMRQAHKLARLFHKWAGEGLCTKPFTRFSHECRARLLAASGLEEDEAPVIACRFSEQSWTLLTTKRLLWQKRTYRSSLPLQAIRRTILHHGKLARHHHELPVTLTCLKILTAEGRLHAIELEAGPSCFGFRYLLKKAAQVLHGGQITSRQPDHETSFD